jgi:hypothetical protein
MLKAKHWQHLFVNKLRGGLKIAAVKALVWRPSQIDAAGPSPDLTGGQVIQ